MASLIARKQKPTSKSYILKEFESLEEAYCKSSTGLNTPLILGEALSVMLRLSAEK